jgi:hypothetical protein
MRRRSLSRKPEPSPDLCCSVERNPDRLEQSGPTTAAYACRREEDHDKENHVQEAQEAQPWEMCKAQEEKEGKEVKPEG